MRAPVAGGAPGKGGWAEGVAGGDGAGGAWTCWPQLEQNLPVWFPAPQFTQNIVFPSPVSD